MQISKNFKLEEFVPKETHLKWGDKSIWFIDKKIVQVAEFYKYIFKMEISKIYPQVVDVFIIVNNWHIGGPYNYRGYRPTSCKVGANESQHRFGRGFDCDVIMKLKDGKSIEADYDLIHKIIKDNWGEFKAAGLTTVEDVSIAATWLHSDIRNTGLETLLVVKP